MIDIGVKEIIKKANSSTFCYSNPNGQGIVDKKDCKCKKRKTCQAYKDYKRFQEEYHKAEMDGIDNRSDIIQVIKPKFSESQWWKCNVVE